MGNQFQMRRRVSPWKPAFFMMDERAGGGTDTILKLSARQLVASSIPVRLSANAAALLHDAIRLAAVSCL